MASLTVVTSCMNGKTKNNRSTALIYTTAICNIETLLLVDCRSTNMTNALFDRDYRTVTVVYCCEVYGLTTPGYCDGI